MATRILIIDDTFTNLILIRYLLEKSCYQVTEARDGAEGLSRARECIPDIILCDLQMDGMDGFEFARHMRLEPELSEIPLIAVTALATVDIRECLARAGFDGYIAKPIDPPRFVQDVEALLPAHLRSTPLFMAAANGPSVMLPSSQTA